MDRKKIIALVLIGVIAVVLIVNRGMMDAIRIDLLVTTISASKSLVLLGFTALGVAIGVLLK